jgi:hypothetical protein
MKRNSGQRGVYSASITLLPNMCGPASTGIHSSASKGHGQSTGCESVTTPFQSVILDGEWMAYKIWLDPQCQTLAQIKQVEGKPGCYSVEGGSGLAYTYSNV